MSSKPEHFHFVGIGGIGMSALAQLLLKKGHMVSGSDLTKESTIISALKSQGCIFFSQHQAKNISGITTLIRSSAINEDNPEIVAAQKKGISILHRAQLLARLMQGHDSIAITGTHGKTTTTALTAHVFTHAGYDPTVIAGGIIKNFNSNARMGGGKLFIVEADESDRSLLHLSPSKAIITNIEAEHLDVYKDLNDIKRTYQLFLENVPPTGKIIFCHDDANIQGLFPPEFNRSRLSSYGMTKTKSNRKSAANMQGMLKASTPSSTRFDVIHHGKKIGGVMLPLLGAHNVLNALAAIRVAIDYDIPFQIIGSALESFKGIQRRFDYLGTYNGAEIFDDYAHHPTEIACALSIAKKRAHNRLIVAFEPHRYSRTQKLWDDFIETFANADIDMLCLTNIYPASEKPLEGITTENLIAALKKRNPKQTIVFTPGYEAVHKFARSHLNPGDLFLTLGAGKLNKIAKLLVCQPS